MRARRLVFLLALLVAPALVATACSSEVEVRLPDEAAPAAPADPDEPADPGDDPADAPPEDDPSAPTPDEAPTPDADGAVVVEGRWSWSEGACDFDEPGDVEIRCGELTVPENWTDPAADATVVLTAAVFSDPAADPGATPIVYLEGGPGGDALETVPFSFDTLFRPFTADRPVIVFDQRGTGFGEPSLACPEAGEVDRANAQRVEDPDVEAEAEVAAFDDCATRLRADGVDLATFNSISSAHDAEALRQALGYERWMPLGISYGTRLGQTLMRLYPDTIEAVILDSVVPLAGDLDADVPASAERAFEALFAGCAADEACNDAYPDLRARFFAVVDALDDDPIEFSAVNPLDGARDDFVADGTDLANVVFQNLYSQAALAGVPAMVAALEDRDPIGLSLAMGQELANEDFFSAGLLVAVRCNEEWPFLTDDAVAAGRATDDRYNTWFADEAVGFFDEVCPLWDAGTAPAEENEPLVSDLPTLVMAGSYDPITPPSGGQLITETLSAGQYVELPHQGHAALSDECGVAIARAFLDDPRAAVDTSCIASSTPPPWVPAPLPASFDPFELDADFAQGSGIFPRGWEPQGDGVWVSPDSNVDQIALFQQGIAGVAADQVAGLLIANLGGDDDVEPVGDVEIDGRTWRNYRFPIPGSFIDLYVADVDGASAIVLFQGPPSRLPLDEEFVTALLAAFDA